MAITYNLVPNPIVIFRDTDGNPAIGGEVSFFEDLARTTPKAIYEDSAGTIPFPNPAPLNGQGAVSNVSGVSKPVYYANDSDYYIEIRDIDGVLVNTVEHYNDTDSQPPSPQTDEVDFTNYFLNAQFRLFDDASLTNDDLISASDVAIANEGWFFRRDTVNSTNSITFKEFILGQTDVPNNPKYYLEFVCITPGTETEKDICFPVGDVSSFSGEVLTVAFYAKCSPALQMSFVVEQEFNDDAPNPQTVQTFSLTPSWTKFVYSFTVDSVTGKNIGADNRIVFKFRMPLNAVCTLDLSNVQLNRGNELIKELEFNYKSLEIEEATRKAYDLPNHGADNRYKSITLNDDGKTQAWVSNPPVGSVITYTALTAPDGYLLCDGTAYRGLSDSKYKRLYDVIGNTFGHGSNYFRSYIHSNLMVIYNTVLGNVTDYSDGSVPTGFSINTLHHGGNFGISAVFHSRPDTIWCTNLSNGTVTLSSAGAAPFGFTRIAIGSPTSQEVTEIVFTNGTTISPGAYFLISSTTTNYYVWYEIDGVGSDPAIGGRSGIKISLPSNFTSELVAIYTRMTMDGNESTKIIMNAGSTITAGSFFKIYDFGGKQYDVWYKVDGIGTEPIGAYSTTPVEILSTDSSAQVATKTHAAMDAASFQVPDLRGWFIRGMSGGSDVDPDKNYRFDGGGGSYGNVIGSTQYDEYKSHKHNLHGSSVGVGVNTPENALLGTTPGDQENFANVGSPADLTMASAMMDSMGGTETRPVNIYMNYIIKY